VIVDAMIYISARLYRFTDIDNSTKV